MVADGGFMSSDPIHGNNGIPLVDEVKVGLKEWIGSRGVKLWLNGQGKWVVCPR